jgi:hypothetical protein
MAGGDEIPSEIIKGNFPGEERQNHEGVWRRNMVEIPYQP